MMLRPPNEYKKIVIHKWPVRIGILPKQFQICQRKAPAHRTANLIRDGAIFDPNVFCDFCHWEQQPPYFCFMDTERALDLQARQTRMDPGGVSAPTILRAASRPA